MVALSGQNKDLMVVSISSIIFLGVIQSLVIAAVNICRRSTLGNSMHLKHIPDCQHVCFIDWCSTAYYKMQYRVYRMTNQLCIHTLSTLLSFYAFFFPSANRSVVCKGDLAGLVEKIVQWNHRYKRHRTRDIWTLMYQSDSSNLKKNYMCVCLSRSSFTDTTFVLM